MADATSKDEAAKARIISHMNADHQKEMSNYLRHYASLSPEHAQSPSLLDITFTHMTLTSRWAAECTPPSAYRIPITPPMTSWSDARRVAIELNDTAMAGLGISDVVVSRWVQPQGAQLASAVFCAACIAATLTVASLKSMNSWGVGNVVFELVGSYFPWGVPGFMRVVKFVAAPITVVHVGECFWMASKLRMYGVQGNVWWQWMASNLIEGFYAHKRLGNEVARVKTAGKKDH